MRARLGLAPTWTRTARTALAIAGAALAGAGTLAPVTKGDIFGPVRLASVGTLGAAGVQQVEYAHDSTISSDGSYVVFDGAVGGETGVWRVNLASRRIQQVAGGDALLPSVSAGGRYVSFTTNQTEAQLVTGTRGLQNEPPLGAPPGPAGAENVYVRDMGLPPNEAGAFTVASATDGSDEPLTYAEAGSELGSVAAGGSAISADGNEVAFVTTAVSNLAGEATPALQVAVRRIASRETILVSGEYDPASGQSTGRPVWAGGRGAVYGDRTRFPEQVPEYSRWIETRPPGAAISADGSTVAWMGVNVGQQARMLPAEMPLPEYTEPLWRRIAAPASPTERVTGGSDPADPQCALSGEGLLPAHPSANDPCQGPFLTHPLESEPSGGVSGIWSAREEGKSTSGDFVPRLSADGYKVAFLSRAEPIGLGEFFANRERGEQPDVYVADMHSGLTRDGALTTVTQLGGFAGSEDAAINEFALSGDGTDVAFTTRRTQFRLAFPAFVSPPAAEPGLDELFFADLSDGTLTRVSQGYGGEASEQPHARKQRETEDVYLGEPTAGATSPAFADGGTLLAFSSTASNLVPNDGNGPQSFAEQVGPRDGSDAFVVEREIPNPLPTPEIISPVPPGPNTRPAWTLGATAVSRRDGSVLLYVRIPGPGVLSASARSTLVVHSAKVSRVHGGRRARGPVTVAPRTVASARRTAGVSEPRPLVLVLRLGKPYASLAARTGGLSASVTVSFTAAGHHRLGQPLQVTFRRQAASSRRSRAAGSRRRHR